MSQLDRTPPSSDISPSSSRSPSPSHSRTNGSMANGNGNGNVTTANGHHDYDPADRERHLAEQLRRRAIASRETNKSPSRSLSRTPPSRSSNSPPPRRGPSGRDAARSPSPEQRRVSGGSTKRRRDEDREYERRKRRSGRDPYDEDRSQSHASHSRRQSRTRQESEDQDDLQSQRSGYSNRAVSRDLDGYPSRSRAREEDRRRRGPRRREPSDYDGYYSRPAYDPRYYHDPYAEPPRYDRRRRRSPSPVRRSPTPDPDDYELRSVFCSQLAARLTRRDLGEFFEERLGDGSVKDVRIVTDRATGRSKGIGYVELNTEDLVDKAIACSGAILCGIPILIQQTEAARNRGEGASTAQAPIRPNLPDAANRVPSIDPNTLANLPLPPHLANAAAARVNGQGQKQSNAAARLYVGSLHFNLVDTDVKAVFEPFGEIEDVDLHREPTGKSKGFAFVQFKQAEDAERAIEHMNGFELAGRSIKVGHVNARGQENRAGSQSQPTSSGAGPTLTSSFDEGGGGGLTAQSRANLMQMLARTDSPSNPITSPQDHTKGVEQIRPASIPQAISRAVLLKNMFNPAEETDENWDTELAEDVKQECESKYGKVEKCHVDRDSSGEIWLRFGDAPSAEKAIAGLNGRWFGGRMVTADSISESFFTARLG